ncbi:DUF4438 domain-containing protein [Catellatospora sp. TT07R-123]|uniref:DUF4438 family protein n=1 Tax=Catellatospora sp. TT07R-123 TaxID=2733863 RepID=UPI001B0591DF|nr:DUF4438 domain-containing protein [Catellatospora sp. TT07R-123]GHJ43090.1 DUF4438 domain-containing protein [Catellatospora sp. TT07R-123]
MTPIAVNLTGVVETPTMPSTPYLVDADGHPYVPLGDCGVVLGVHIGDGVFDHDADHVAPGVTLSHADQSARHALTAFACFGNRAMVRTGAAAGAPGFVLGKRGEQGRVIVVFDDETLAQLVPGDTIVVRGRGQGAELPGVHLLNADPDALDLLPLVIGDGQVHATVRAVFPSRVAGNGIGRPAQMWDIDLQLTPDDPEAAGLRLGDLVAVDDLDVRHNTGYRGGYRTVGLIVHGGSPLPGHGPGLMPILCAPAANLPVSLTGDAAPQLTLDRLHFRP